jgi:hypothetical protein
MNALITFQSVMDIPDPAKSFIITKDASQVALGAVFSQDLEGGNMPEAFACRRYSAIEMELLWIVWAIEQFGPMFTPRTFY